MSQKNIPTKPPPKPTLIDTKPKDMKIKKSSNVNSNNSSLPRTTSIQKSKETYVPSHNVSSSSNYNYHLISKGVNKMNHLPKQESSHNSRPNRAQSLESTHKPTMVNAYIPRINPYNIRKTEPPLGGTSDRTPTINADKLSSVRDEQSITTSSRRPRSDVFENHHSIRPPSVEYSGKPTMANAYIPRINPSNIRKTEPPLGGTLNRTPTINADKLSSVRDEQSITTSSRRPRSDALENLQSIRPPSVEYSGKPTMVTVDNSQEDDSSIDSPSDSRKTESSLVGTSDRTINDNKCSSIREDRARITSYTAHRPTRSISCDTKPISLRNSGANCYLNSALQGISSCTEFVAQIIQLQSENNDLIKLRTFKILMERLCDENSASLDISSNHIFRDWNKPGQQDSYELLAYVLNQVYNELRSDQEAKGIIEKRNLDSWLRVPLPMRILLKYSITCGCGLASSSPLQSDLAFHVSISSPKESLQTLFDQYFDKDPIEDYECDEQSCHGLSANRIVKLQTPLPDTICIHLQRTFWNSGRMQKIEDKIIFTDSIVIKKEFCKHDDKTEDQSRNTDKKYSLVSVIVHSDHHICYKRLGDCWYYTSDSSIHRLTWDEVSNCEAYVLFYEVNN